MQAPLTMIVNAAPGLAPGAARRQAGIVEAAVAALYAGAGVRFEQASPAASGTPEIGPDQRGFFVMFANNVTIEEIVGGTDAGLRGAILGTG